MLPSQTAYAYNCVRTLRITINIYTYMDYYVI